MNRGEQVEADATRHKLDEYPGLEQATLAAMAVVQAGQAAYGRYEAATKAAMDSLSSAGWKFKPAKKMKKGKTIREMLWADLDAVMSRLMAEGEAAEESDKGEAYGLARAIALMDDPWQPDIDAVRAEAVERWEETHGE